MTAADRKRQLFAEVAAAMEVVQERLRALDDPTLPPLTQAERMAYRQVCDTTTVLRKLQKKP